MFLTQPGLLVFHLILLIVRIHGHIHELVLISIYTNTIYVKNEKLIRLTLNLLVSSHLECARGTVGVARGRANGVRCRA